MTYDTGGADIKAGGVMAGMHRDKCGSAAVAGFFQVLGTLVVLQMIEVKFTQNVITNEYWIIIELEVCCFQSLRL